MGGSLITRIDIVRELLFQNRYKGTASQNGNPRYILNILTMPIYVVICYMLNKGVVMSSERI